MKPKYFLFATIPLVPVKEAFLNIQKDFRSQYSQALLQEAEQEKVEGLSSRNQTKGQKNLKFSFRFDLESDLKINDFEISFLEWGKSFRSYPSIQDGVHWMDVNLSKIPYGFHTLQMRLKVAAPEAFTPFQGMQQNLENTYTKIIVVNEESKEKVYRLQASVVGWLAETLDFKVTEVR